MNRRENYQIFFARWVINSFVLWVLMSLFGKINYDGSVAAIFLLAGFIFSLVNHFLRPLLVFLSIPAIMLTLGLFTLVINGIVIWITIKLTPGLSISLINAILAGIVMSFINRGLSTLVEGESR